MQRRLFTYKLATTQCIVALLLCIFTLNASAATRTTIVTEIKRGDKQEIRTDVFTVDGNKARLDMYSGEVKTPTSPSHMITLDDGKTWYFTDPTAGKTVCTKWDTVTFFREIGELVHYVQEMTGAEISEGEFKVTLNEPGPKLLGYETQHVKLHYSLDAEAWLLFKKFEYTLEFHDEVWFSPGLKLSNIEQTWINAMSETSSKQLDNVSKKWNQNVKETVIKMITDVTIHNKPKNRKEHKQERMEITRLETLKDTDLPAKLFEVPKCEKVSDEKMEEQVKKYLKGVAK